MEGIRISYYVYSFILEMLGRGDVQCDCDRRGALIEIRARQHQCNEHGALPNTSLVTKSSRTLEHLRSTPRATPHATHAVPCDATDRGVLSGCTSPTEELCELQLV